MKVPKNSLAKPRSVGLSSLRARVHADLLQPPHGNQVGSKVGHPKHVLEAHHLPISTLEHGLAHAFRPARRVLRSRPPPVPGTHAMALRPSSVPLRFPLLAPPESSLPEAPDPESDRAHAASPTVSRLLATAVTDPSFESAAASALIAELLDFAAACHLDYTTVLVASLRLPVLRPSGASMDAEMASWKSTGTYVDEFPPSWANIVNGMWIFRVKRPPGSPPALKARYVARGFRQLARGDLATPSTWFHLDVSSMYPGEPPPASLRSPPGASRVARHTETTLAALGFAPSTTDPYLGLQITRDRARRTITLTQSHMVHQVLQRFGFQFSSPLPTPLSTSHSLSPPPSEESVEPSGPYPEFVGCLMVLHYLCCTSGMGLMLGGRGPVVLTGDADAFWVDDSATQRSSQGYTFILGSGSISWRSTRSSSVLSSSCEAEIYVGAMAAQELRWLTYLLTNLGEQPRSPPVLYIDNKTMIALCHEHRLEHRTKHIALRYFLAQELQQRGQLRLAYVATRANTADVFTKALPPCDHQCFSTVLSLVPTLPHLLTA
ncbi:unnamed protein product [Closterium sp. NIES-54]